MLSNSYFATHCDGFQKSRYPELPSGVVRSVTMQTMLRADPIYVSDDVMTLWEHASKTFKEEIIRRDDLVVPCGFALLPRPFEITDIHGKHVKYRAIGWLPISTSDTYSWDEGVKGQGVWLSLISNIEDVDDYWLDTHTASDGTAGSVIRDLSLERGHIWSLMHGAPLVFDQSYVAGIVDDNGDLITNEATAELGGQIYSHVQCFWRLMGQLVMVPESLPRQARRQRQREQRVSDVKVLRLRRSKPKHDHDLPEGAGVEWSHRWIVEGHWRNQPYGPRDKPTHYRQIWISPYVKGPEDKEIVVKKRGVEFTR
jgi:hypothetical protein